MEVKGYLHFEAVFEESCYKWDLSYLIAYKLWLWHYKEVVKIQGEAGYDLEIDVALLCKHYMYLK